TTRGVTAASRRSLHARSSSSSVAARRVLEDDGLGLEERQQTLGPALAADARLLEAAERDPEVGAERVVANGPGADLAGDHAGPVGVVGEHGGVEPVDRVVGQLD